MYDTKTRIALGKKRMHEYHRRQSGAQSAGCLFCVPCYSCLLWEQWG